LAAVGELFVAGVARSSQTEDWAVDTVEAVAAEVAAELRISQALAASKLRYGRAMRERLPLTAALFLAGDIGFALFATLVYRTDLITDPDVLAAVDAELAGKVGRWPSMTRSRLSGQVDKIVAEADLDAVRRRQQSCRERHVWIGDTVGELSEIHGRLHSTDAHALDRRLDAVAATVCAHDPRSREQRRADALGALAAGADRLGCRCGRPDCAAGQKPPASPVVIHVIAEPAALAGEHAAVATEIGAGALIPVDLLAELAASAKLVALAHPLDAPPEKGYAPSKALADFIRCRDLTCRWPGCDRPAGQCDLDHTIPFAQGGPTHASNLKCYCRTHHLVKTFWGWHDQQLPDGTLILTSPAGRTYVTTPGSALLFPQLCAPPGDLPPHQSPTAETRCGNRPAMMPRRRRTRDQDRAHRINTERRQNHTARTTIRTPEPTHATPATTPDDDPPPF
jgi:hypothetical protein